MRARVFVGYMLSGFQKPVSITSDFSREQTPVISYHAQNHKQQLLNQDQVNETSDNEKPDTSGSAKIVYILYLVSIAIGITAIIGLVMAYVNRDEAPDWLQTHYRFQIRTFWTGALYLFTGIFLSQFIFGLFIILFWLLWLIVRCTKGIKFLDRKQAYPDPAGWMF